EVFKQGLLDTGLVHWYAAVIPIAVLIVFSLMKAPALLALAAGTLWTYVKKVDSTVSLNEPFFYLRTTLFESFGSLCIMERIKNRFLPLHRAFLVFDEPLLLAHLMARLQF